MNAFTARRARILFIPLLLCWLVAAQAQNVSPSATETASPTPTPAPTAVTLPDIVSASDAASQRLDQIQSEISENQITANITRDLATATEEINARLDETRRILTPGAPLDTVRELETRWQKTADQLTIWTRALTDRATALDRQLAEMPDLRTTWKATFDLARSSNAPPELMQRIENVLKSIDTTEAALEKRRTEVLTLQTRVAGQMQRVQGALRSVKSAQSAAVNRIWAQDSPPIWRPEVWRAATQALARDTETSLGTQASQLSTHVGREWTKLVCLGLLLLAFAFALQRIKRHAARWTDEDSALERANRVLHLPFATAGVLTFLCARAIIGEAPRALWIILATLALIPIVVLLRRLIDRHLFPIVNALVVFYIVAQLRALAAAMPVLSRIILLLEAIGGAIFLAWFIRSTRRSGPRTTSASLARAGARIAFVLFLVVLVANVLGYVALANYLTAGGLATAYLAVLLYAAAGILEGLVLFALQIWPLSALAMVRRHRPLLRRRIAGVIKFIAILIWVLLSLGAFSVREPAISYISGLLNAEMSVGSLRISLGAVLAFALTIWITLLLSRFIRFLLEEEIYDRFHLARGSAYAVSTLVHYVILLLGFYAAIAALGADMTKFAILAGAFGVGIGFGLQNIFNNFFSGLILLFERPVQVGDVIELGTVTGTVRRIGIRASIITLADKSQLIVPNGQLISDKVTNRTISSRQKRLEIPIRVAYGSNPEEVISLLTKTAATVPKVLQDPPPDCALREFGVDGLVFVVGFTTEEVLRSQFVQSDVAVAVNAALRDAGIEIPYPQRIVHLEGGDQADNESPSERRAHARSDGNSIK